MKELKFSSQICTTKEQSKKLLELGLKPETADMYLTNMSGKGLNYTNNWQVGSSPFSNCKKSLKDVGLILEGTNVKNSVWEMIPAWSLHRLMEIADFTGIAFLDVSKAYDSLIDIISDHIKFNELNDDFYGTMDCKG